MKDIKGYEGEYGITSCGRVWSYKSNKFLSNKNDKYGYCFVTLCKNGVTKNFKIHRLVAEAYIPNPNNLPMVNHKDEIKTHNWTNNLEWCDAKYNHQYSSTGNRFQWKKTLCVETGEIFESAKLAAEHYGVVSGAISRAARLGKMSCGYHWKYVEG